MHCKDCSGLRVANKDLIKQINDVKGELIAIRHLMELLDEDLENFNLVMQKQVKRYPHTRMLLKAKLLLLLQSGVYSE